MADMETTKVMLARTWNANESGLLWEAHWYQEGGTFYRHGLASGVFVSPYAFPNEDAFWSAYRREAREFHGARQDGPFTHSFTPERERPDHDHDGWPLDESDRLVLLDHLEHFHGVTRDDVDVIEAGGATLVDLHVMRHLP